MIKNEKQYKISKKKLAEIASTIDEFQAKATTSLSQKVILASIKNFKLEIEQKIKIYQKPSFTLL